MHFNTTCDNICVLSLDYDTRTQTHIHIYTHTYTFIRQDISRSVSLSLSHPLSFSLFFSLSSSLSLSLSPYLWPPSSPSRVVSLHTCTILLSIPTCITCTSCCAPHLPIPSNPQSIPKSVRDSSGRFIHPPEHFPEFEDVSGIATILKVLRMTMICHSFSLLVLLFVVSNQNDHAQV